MAALEKVHGRYGDVTPIVLERSVATDTRFWATHDFMREMERICDKQVIDSIKAVEPIGSKKLFNVMVICPCTGNALVKLAVGITDSSVSMAAKAHLRNGNPLVIVISANDGLLESAPNIGALMDKKNVYFVPYGQAIRRVGSPAWWPTSPTWRIPLRPSQRPSSFRWFYWVRIKSTGWILSTRYFSLSRGRCGLKDRRREGEDSSLGTGYKASCPYNNPVELRQTVFSSVG